MKLPTITTLIITLFFLSPTLTQAKVYTWKDKNGITHYSATPPRPNEKISNLKDDLRITDNKAKAHQAQQTNPKETTPNAEEEAKKERRIATRKKRNYCDGQRKNLALLKRNPNVKWIENGKSTPLTKEQHNDKIRALEDSISTDCSYGDEATERRQHPQNKTTDQKLKD